MLRNRIRRLSIFGQSMTRYSARYARRRRMDRGHLEDLEDRCLLSSITVNTTLDQLDGDTTSPEALLISPGLDGLISLREAIVAANNTEAADAILLGPGTYQLQISGADEDAGGTGDLDILHELTIIGSGSGVTAVDAAGLDRVFHIHNAAATLQSLTITGGHVAAYHNGAGISSVGGSELHLFDTHVVNNTSGGDGGGISLTGGTAEIQSCSISDNHTLQSGAGLALTDDAELLLSDSEIARNTADNSAGALLIVSPESTVNVRSSVISSNHAVNSGGGISNIGTLSLIDSELRDNVAGASAGGALVSSGGFGAGAVTLLGCDVVGNTATRGGGIYNNGAEITVDASHILNNLGTADGGGIYSGWAAHTQLVRTTVDGNEAAGMGGGAYLHYAQTFDVSLSTLSSNLAYSGGAIHSLSKANIAATTISENTATYGGGIILGGNDGRLTLTNATIAGNVAHQLGGGVYKNSYYSQITVHNTILADNVAPLSPDLYGPVVSLGHNLLENPQLAQGITNGVQGDLVGIDPGLGPLQDSGGLTYTHALLPGSPAIDAGDPALTSSSDQRAVPRILDGDGLEGATPDIGAFEAGAWIVNTSADTQDTLLGDGIPADSNGDTSLRAAVMEANQSTQAAVILLDAETYAFGVEYGGDDNAVWGDLDVRNPLAIVGEAAGLTIIDAGGLDRVFQVHGTSLTLAQLTARGGRVESYHHGGGILNDDGQLTLRDAEIADNTATGDLSLGGGILSRGTNALLDVSGTEIHHNTSVRYGGGVDIEGGLANLADTSVHHNSSQFGGGLANFGATAVTIDGCQFTGNTALFGAGFYNRTNVAIADSLWSHNYAMARGGGLVNGGDMTIRGTTFFANQAEEGGGGFTNNAALTMTSSVVEGNTTLTRGGGIENNGTDADLTVSTTTIRNNTADTSGGGVYQQGGISNFESTTFAGNYGLWGGAFEHNYGTSVSLENCTLSENASLYEGAAIHTNSPFAVDGCTIVNNVTGSLGGAGIYKNGTADITVRNTVIADNQASSPDPDVRVSSSFPESPFTSLGHNLIGNATAATGFVNGLLYDQVGSSAQPLDPQLGPLTSNGGPTLTHKPLVGSPLIDAGDDSNTSTTDQTLATRILDGDANGIAEIDIGAVEFDSRLRYGPFVNSQADEVLLRTHGTSVDIVVNNVLHDTQPLDGLTGIVIVGTPFEDDSLTVDLTRGSDLLAPGLEFQGGEGGQDLLTLSGSGNTVVYTPDATTTGHGALEIDGYSLVFSGLEPIDISGMASVTVAMPAAGNEILVEAGKDFTSGVRDALRFSGSFAGLAWETVSLRDTDTIVLDTSLYDGTDTVRLLNGNNAHANGDLTIVTGTGADVVSVEGPFAISGDMAVTTYDFTTAPETRIDAASVALVADSVVLGTLSEVAATGAVSVITNRAGTSLTVESAATIEAGTTLSLNGNQMDVDGAFVAPSGIEFVRGTTLLTGTATAPTVTVYDGAALGGTGLVDGAVSVQSGAQVAPGLSAGQLTTGTTTFVPGAQLDIELEGTSAGSTYDQLRVLGDVDLGGATLQLTVNVAPQVGDSFTIIDSTGTITGEFADFPDQTIREFSGYSFEIDYHGGDGSDVVLTAAPSAHGLRYWTGGGNDPNWSTPANWDYPPRPGDSLEFGAASTEFAPVNDLPAGTLFEEIRLTSANYLIEGQPITLGSRIDSSLATGANTLNLDLICAGNVELANDSLANLSLGGDIQLDSHALSVTGKWNVDISGVISGTGQLLKQDPNGWLRLSADNTYSGTTEVTGGVVVVSHPHALGSLDAGTIVGPGGHVSVRTTQAVLEPMTILANGYLDLAETGALYGGAIQLAGRLGGTVQAEAAGSITLLADGRIANIGPGDFTVSGPVDLQSYELSLETPLGLPNHITGDITGTGSVRKSGSGTWLLSGANTYTGGTSVAQGTLTVNGSLASPDVSVETAATLSGGGDLAGTITVQPAGRLEPGGVDRTLSAGGVVFVEGATLALEIDGDQAGFDYDQLIVTSGDVQLNDASLTLTVGALEAAADSYTLIDNQGLHPVTGHFADLREGTAILVGDNWYRITYTGGDGNDVVLSRGPATLHWQGDAGNSWGTPSNWLEEMVPLSGDTLVFDTQTFGFAENFTPHNDLDGLVVQQIEVRDDSYLGDFLITGNRVSLVEGLITSGLDSTVTIDLELLALTSSQSFLLDVDTVLLAPVISEIPGSACDLFISSTAAQITLPSLGTSPGHEVGQELGQLTVFAGGNATFDGSVVTEGVITASTSGVLTINQPMLASGYGSILLYAGLDFLMYSGIALNAPITSSDGNVLATTPQQMEIGPAASIMAPTGDVELLCGMLSIAPASAGIESEPTSGVVALAPFRNGLPITLGNKTGYDFGLANHELDSIRTGTLRIGSPTAGLVTIFGTIQTQQTETLHLMTAETVVLDSGGSIRETNLAIEAGSGDLLLSSDNDVDVLAVYAGNGFVYFVDNSDLTIGEVDGIRGVTATASSVVLSAPGDISVSENIEAALAAQVLSHGDQELVSLNADVTAEQVRIIAGKLDLQGHVSAGTGTVSIESPNWDATVALGAEGDADDWALQLSAAELDSITAGTLRIGVPYGGPIRLDGTIAPVGVDELWLQSSQSIQQMPDAQMTIPGLLVETTGDVWLRGSLPHRISRFAADIQGTGNLFLDADRVTVDTVAGVSGISVVHGSALLRSMSGSIVIQQPIVTDASIQLTTQAADQLIDINTTLGAETIELSSDDMALEDGGLQAMRFVSLTPSTAGTTLRLGGDLLNIQGGRLELADVELDSVTSPTLRIGSRFYSPPVSAGAISIASSIAPAGITTLHVISSNVVWQAPGAMIHVPELAVTAGTGIFLNDAANMVSVLAAETAVGDASFRNEGDLTIGVAGGVDGTGYVSGFSAAGSDAALDVHGRLDLVAGVGISAPAGRVRLSVDDLMMDPASAGIQTAAGTESVVINTYTAGRAISLGLDVPGQLGLTDTELDQIQAAMLEVGSSTAGSISIAGPIDPTYVSSMSLMTGGDVSQTAGGGITIPQLAAAAGGQIALDDATSLNDANVIALQGNLGVAYRDIDDVAIGEVGSLYGVHSAAGGVSLTTMNGPLIVSDTPASIDLSGQTFVTLHCDESAGSSNSMFIESEAVVSSMAGPVSIAAGDNLEFVSGSSVEAAAGPITLTIGADDTDNVGIAWLGGRLSSHVPIEVSGAAGFNTILILDSAAFANGMNIVGGPGGDWLQYATGENLWNVTDMNAGTVLSGQPEFGPVSFSGVENLVGGGGSDEFVLADGVGLSGTVLGGPGIDTLNYATYTTAVAVDLAAGTATSIGSIGEIENVTGGSAGNVLSGDDSDNELIGGTGIDLLDGVGGNDVLSGGLGDDSLTGGAGYDTLVESADVNFVLSNVSLTGVGTDTLDSLEAARLTGGSGNNRLTVSSWTGDGTLVGGGGLDTVIAAASGDFVLTEDLLTTSDGMRLQLIDITDANLLGRQTNDTFNVQSWSGAVTVNGGAGEDTLFASITDSHDIALSDGLLTATNGLELNLLAIENVELQGGAGDTQFDVGGWTGRGTLAGGGGFNTIVASKGNVTFSLGDARLSASDGLDLVLNAIADATLVGTSKSIFDVSKWTGTGQILGEAGATVSATKDADFVLSDVALATTDGMSMRLQQVTLAALAGGNGNDTFDLSGWNGGGTLSGGAGYDTFILMRDTDFVLADALLEMADGTQLVLAGLENAWLTGRASDNVFTISQWTGAGSIDGGAGLNRLVVSRDAPKITLSTSRIIVTDGASMSLKNVDTATLSGGPSANTIDARSFSGTTEIDGLEGNDTLFGSNDSDVIRGGDGHDVILGYAGSDRVFGGKGRDLLIGGLGTDTLYGDNGEDILIGGSTIYDDYDRISQPLAFNAIMQEWTRDTDYAIRIANLRAGIGPTQEYALNSSTVIDDGAIDSLWGNKDLDWFFISELNELADWEQPKGKKPGEARDFIL